MPGMFVLTNTGCGIVQVAEDTARWQRWQSEKAPKSCSCFTNGLTISTNSLVEGTRMEERV